ncbi:MAG TPA: hypothetical protein VKZ67_10770 [Natronosporangium sp.]|nr:hypothetical protein [Natronosporangium sp.]
MAFELESDPAALELLPSEVRQYTPGLFCSCTSMQTCGPVTCLTTLE